MFMSFINSFFVIERQILYNWRVERAHLVVQLVRAYVSDDAIWPPGCLHATRNRNWPCLFRLPSMCSIQLVYAVISVSLSLKVATTFHIQATLRAVRVSMSLLRGLRSLKGLANGGSTSSNGSCPLEDTCQDEPEDVFKK